MLIGDAANILVRVGWTLWRPNEGTMRKTILLAAYAAATALATPALAAGNPDGHWQIKLLATGVLPDGKITSVSDPNNILLATDQTKANDNVVPTIAIEYYASPNISIETICCLTSHHVSGTGTLSGATNIVDHVMILPATVTLKYHFNTGAIRPYVGVGPSLFLVLDEKPGSSISGAPLNVSKVRMSNEVGLALQAGVDIAVNDSGLGISLDAKRYFNRSTAHYYVGTTEVLATRHKLDPWVVSGGVYFRF
jgi:outer membrane protein